MASIVCKITDENGVERQFGPLDISTEIADVIAAQLTPSDDAFWAAATEYREAEVAGWNEERNVEGQAANDAYVAAAAEEGA